MANPLVKLGPLAGFLVAVGYCAWPYAAPPRAPAASPSRMPKIDASWLKPHFGPALGRDPFRGPDAPPRPSAVAARPPATPAGAPVGAPAGPAGRAGAAGAGPMPGFRLGATLVAGGHRSAIIDGRVYRQGERVESADGTWTVQWVEPGRVLLAGLGRARPAALELPDAAIATARGGRAGRPTPPAAGVGLSAARLALAAAGIDLPAPDLLERLAARSGGSLSGAYRALLGVLASPPRPASGPPATADAASGTVADAEGRGDR